MTTRYTFYDLAGLADPNVRLTADDDRWLAAVAARCDANVHTISVATSHAAAEPEPVLERDFDGSWRAGRYVGELRHGDRVLEILPRLGIETIAAWASAALNLRVVPHAGERAGTQALIAELTAAIWRGSLLLAARRGLPGLRTTKQHVGVNARGRLDMNGTIALRATRTPLLACIERPKATDNPVSRAIVLADRALDSQLRHRPGWRGDRVSELIPRLRAATGSRPKLPTRFELDRVRYSPITLPYRRVAELSWQIAHRRGARTSASNDTVEGLLIDVAELWELFVLHCTRRATSMPVTHGTNERVSTPLYRSLPHSTRTLGRLYPDIVVGDRTHPAYVIDAKYKPLAEPRGVDREDLYQLTSYLLAHSTDGMLAYPHLDERPLAYAERHNPWLSPVGHSAQFSRLPLTEDACAEAIRRILYTDESPTRRLTAGNDNAATRFALRT